jgi:hypothetical protein
MNNTVTIVSEAGKSVWFGRGKTTYVRASTEVRVARRGGFTIPVMTIEGRRGGASLARAEAYATALYAHFGETVREVSKGELVAFRDAWIAANP